MARTMLRDGRPTFARFSAALREFRHATAVELAQLRHRGPIRSALPRRDLVTLAARRGECQQWALGVLCAALGEVPGWAPPVSATGRARCVRLLEDRVALRRERAIGMPCGHQDAMGERDACDERLATYLDRYCVTR